MKITKNTGKVYSVKTKSPKAVKPKTVKVAINNRHGGFSLSPKAIHWLACRQGKPCYFYKSEFVDGNLIYTAVSGYPDGVFWVASTSKELTADNYDESTFDLRPTNRSDPELIAVIEELGEEANGACADIKIVKIPIDVKWHVEEYDGMEWIAENHKTWY